MRHGRIHSTRRALLCIAGAVTLLPGALRAQAARPRKVVWLYWGGEKARQSIRDRIRSRGIVEGRDIVLDLQPLPANNDAEGDRLADRLVGSRPDIIVMAYHQAAWSLKKRTREIAVIFYNMGDDPVAAGFVDSLARPGSNFTGTTQNSEEFRLKGFHMLKQLLPKLKRVGLLFDKEDMEELERSDPQRVARLRERTKVVEGALGFEHVWLKIPGNATKDEIAGMVRDSGVQAVFVSTQQPEATAFVFAAPIPTSCGAFRLVRKGCLLGASFDWDEGESYAVQAMERILRGESPAVIPVYQTGYSFALNRRRARELGIEIPPAVLLQMKEIYD